MMKPKIKLIYILPYFAIKILRARRIAKKIKKFSNESRYSEQWKNDYILKVAKRFLRFLNIKVEVVGYKNVPKTTSLMAVNHTSMVDPMAILVALENHNKAVEHHNFLTVFLAKTELSKNKMVAGFLNILNTFYIDRQNPRAALETLNKITDYAKEHQKHIVIFPEGTRSKDGQLQPFKSGAFRIAKKAFLPIIPITINNATAATNLSRSQTLKLQVIFHAQIKPISIISMSYVDIAHKVKTIISHDLKTKS